MHERSRNNRDYDPLDVVRHARPRAGKPRWPLWLMILALLGSNIMTAYLLFQETRQTGLLQEQIRKWQGGGWL